MQRRKFLKTGLKLMGAGAIASAFPMQLSANSSSSKKRLVVIFNYTANDTLNMLVPYKDEIYKTKLRPLLKINANEVYPLGKHKGTDFGLNKSMEGLHELWEQGKVAFMPATYSGEPQNTSHFYQFKFVGSGNFIGGEYDTSGSADKRGWVAKYMLNRYKEDINNKNLPMRTFDFTAGFFNVFEGYPTLGLTNPAQVFLGIEHDKAKGFIDSVSDVTDRSGNSLSNSIENEKEFTIDYVEQLGNYDYDDTSGKSQLGKQLLQTKALFENNDDLEIVYLNKGGWDTHTQQKNNHNKLLSDLSASIKDFYDAMGDEKMKDTTILVLSEFGRTAQENSVDAKVVGTDHGHAFCSVVIGGSVKGGIYGNWTKLKDEKYLTGHVDYRDVISEILSSMGNDTYANAAFEHNGVKKKYQRTPIGFA